MKKCTKRLVGLLAALACVGGLSLTMIGCGDDAGDPTDTGATGTDTTAGDTAASTDETAPETQAATQATTQPETQPAGKVSYAFTVQSIGGLKLKGVNIYIYADSALEDLISFGTTDDNGAATITLNSSDKYVAVLSGLPAGYKPESYYSLTGESTTIRVTSSVITDSTSTGSGYTLGSVMYDFKVTDTDGTVHQLSELLKTKKVVMLNFWATWCTYCIGEFPDMDASYQKYKDKVEILALDPDADDTEQAITAAKAQYGVSFPMAKDYTTLSTAGFNVAGFPTTVIIDRYGVVSYVHSGAIPAQIYFDALFEYYTADNYEQKLLTDLSELVPKQVPTETMPSSEEIRNTFAPTIPAEEISFAPETNPGDAEYSWPFIFAPKDGQLCLKPSNNGVDSSFATMYVTIKLEAGEALAFDYLSSTEQGSDNLFLLAKNNNINKDTYKDIFQISGVGTEWATCYTFVAEEAGEYSIGFCYIKDGSTNTGDDTVYLKNLRVVPKAEIDVPTYIFRYAVNNMTADGSGYTDYVNVVYNEVDGYYHVGTVDGPLLLADLMKPTRFSQTSIYYSALDGKIVLDGKAYNDQIVPYATFASNSNIYGLCTVNQELKELLVITANALGLENDNPNQWLQMCCYYTAYGTDGKQLEDPTQGLYTTDENDVAVIDPDRAIIATEGENVVVYDRILRPRGLLYKFTPTRSGAYRIVSKSDIMVDGWIFNEDGTTYYLYEGGERFYADDKNVSMLVYFEAGVNYYIDICYSFDETGSFTFDISYEGESAEQFVNASPGPFTSKTEDMGELAEIIAGGIKVTLGDDGFYHELREDGTLGSILYLDAIYNSSIFEYDTFETLINKGGFDFTKTEGDEYVLSFMAKHGEGTKDYLKEYWGEQFEELSYKYKLDEVLAGTLHGTGTDLTEEARAFLSQIIERTDENPELEGCIPVSAELAELLQALMDKYSFKGVENSWTKLCYYYRAVEA